MDPARQRFLVFGLMMGAGWSATSPLADPEPLSRSINSSQYVSPAREKRALLPEEKKFDLLRERGVSHRLSTNQQHVFRIDLKNDQFLRVDILQRGIDIRLQLFDLEKGPLLTVDSPIGSSGLEPVLFVAGRAGTYSLVVSTTSQPGPDASYVVREVERRTATRDDRKRALALQSYYRARSLLWPAKPNLDAAAQAFLSAADALRRVRNQELEALAWAELGRVYVRQGRWDLVVVANQNAAALFHRLGRKQEEGIALNQMAEGAQKIGNIDQARQLYERAQNLAREARDGATEASALINLGQIQAERVEAWEASRSLREALAICRKRKDQQREARALGALGLLYSLTGQIEEALSFYRDALALREVSRDLRAVLLTQMGNAYIYGGRADRAFRCFQQAFDIQRGGWDPANEASTLVGFGIAYTQLGRYQDALGPYQRALKIYEARNDLRGRAITLTNIGWALSQLTRYGEARDGFSQALDLARKLKNPNLEAAVRLGFAWMERQRDNLSEAQRQAEQALRLVEFLRNETEDPKVRVAFFSDKQDIYELFISVLMRRSELKGSRDLVAKALWVSESARARNLLDHMEGRGGGIARSVLTSRQIQERVLDHDTVLLEYFLGKSKSYLWMMSQDGLEAFELPDRQEIELLVTDVYARLAKSHLAEEQAGALQGLRELSRMLLGPIAGRLGSKRLLIVPSGALQYFPFAALLDPAVSIPRTLPRGAWPSPLMERHEITYAPSASVLDAIGKRQDERKAASKLLAVLADGVFERDDPRLSGIYPAGIEADSDPVLGYLDRLDASRDEADAITAGLPPDKIRKVLDFDARRDIVTSGELGDFGILHFATHTFFQPQISGLAAIILSRYDEKGRARDGLLRIQDINALSFKSDLVVLSSCDSGLGKNVPGEGLVGFPQAFLSAGSSGVVTSVWKVEDTSTAELMRLFYGNLLTHGMLPSAALRAAQITMWKDARYSAPRYWAGFIAQGAWRHRPPYINKNPPGVSSGNGDPRSPSMTTKPSLSVPPR